MAYENFQVEFYQNLGGINEKASEFIVTPGFFLSLRNYGFERPGALVSRPGTSDHASFGFATFFAHPAGLVRYSLQAFGASESFMVFDSGNFLYSLTTSPVALGSSLSANATTGYPIDFVQAKNRLYYANGYNFGHIGLSQCLPYSMPGATGFVAGFGSTLITNAVSGGMTTILPSGTYAITYAYARAVEGISFSIRNASLSIGSFEVGERYPGPSFAYVSLGATTVAQAPTVLVDGMLQPDNAGFDGWGISLVAIYVAFPGATFTFLNIAWGDDNASPSTLKWASEIGVYREDRGEPDQIPLFTLVPRYLDIYKNMLFLSGFSSAPSTVWHSEVGDTENVQPENFIDIRTDNGDAITCIKSFQNTLVVFKASSIHEINGDSPETISLKDMTLEYGCVNNEAAVVWESSLWFVDRRGICEYQGSNTFIVSDAVNETFKSLDVSKAKAFHVKKRNEVWFSFGSTSLVYDYSAKSWTVYDGFNIEYGKGAAIVDYGQSAADLSFFRSGSSHYQLVRFDDSIGTDRGQAITLIFQTPNIKRIGETSQEMFRRFYLDAGKPTATLSATLSVLTNYNASASYSFGFYLDAFQKRIETAISAKAASYKLVLKSTEKITVNGYAIHAKYLRSV